MIHNIHYNITTPVNYEMLTQIHILLTYTCNYECDHCFLYCSSEAKGTFTLDQIKTLIHEAHKIGTIEWFYFEGGEPFLFYPLLIESIKLAKNAGYKVGIVSNGFWATSSSNAELYIQSIEALKVDELMVSNDSYHYGDEIDNFATVAVDTGESSSCVVYQSAIDPPRVTDERKSEYDKAMPIVDSDVMFRGRAADLLTPGLPTKPWNELQECPYEDLVNPTRVHIDAYGNVQICQGLNIGNCWSESLSKIVSEYEPSQNPICSALNRGGPAQLIKEMGMKIDTEFVDECHACYVVRKQLLEKYPIILGPPQVYGI